MFEQDRLDEEVKKKKRRVLAVLLVLLLGTAAASSSVIEQTASSAAVPRATDAPVHTPAPTRVLLPTEEPTATSAPTSTPRPTATATHISIPPTATEEFGGAGGGELDASVTPTVEPTGAVAPTEEPTATSAPTATPQPTATDAPPLPTPTPEEPGRLPVTGVGVGGSGRLMLGLASIWLGVLLLAAGFALREEKTSPMVSRPAPPVADDALPALEETECPSGTDAGAPVRLALGLVIVASVLMLIAGYALHRARKQ
jgi:hypothetical protein